MEKTLTAISQVLSRIFSPLLCGTYAMVLVLWLSYLAYSTLQAKLVVLMVTFVATCIIPVIAIFAMWKIGLIREPGLNSRRERMVPYLVTVAGYLAVAVYTRIVNAPMWLTLFVTGGAIALIIDTVVNRWWKISGHTTGMGAICALLLFLMLGGIEAFSLTWIFLLAVLLTGMVGTARMILGRHTLWQVLAGWACGFISTIALPLIFLS